jgi:hypothetical protein
MRRGEKEEQEVETKKYEIQKKLEINRINQFDVSSLSFSFSFSSLMLKLFL